MSDNEWKAWCASHKARFCINSRLYDDMLAKMRPAILKIEATREEMEAASYWLWEDEARSKSPWESHFSMLKGFVMRRRFEAEQAVLKAERDRIAKEHDQRVKAERGKDFLGIAADTQRLKIGGIKGRIGEMP